MNYQRLHDEIIQDSRLTSPIGFKHNNKTMGYKERHHIVPRCMGGTNDPSNLIYLTARRHFVVHRLLTKIYPSHAGVIYAFQLMFAKTSASLNSRRVEDIGWVRSISKNFAEFRRLRSLIPNKSRLGTIQSQATKDKISQTTLGVPKSNTHRENISRGKLGKKFTENHKAALRESRKRQIITPEHRANLSAAAKRDWAKRKQLAV